MPSWTHLILLFSIMILMITGHHGVASSVNKEAVVDALPPGGSAANDGVGDRGGARCPGDRLQSLLSFAWGLPPSPSAVNVEDDAVRLLALRNDSLLRADEEPLLRLVQGVALGALAGAPIGNATLLHFLAAADDAARLRLLLPRLLWATNATVFWLFPRDIRLDTPLHWAAANNSLSAMDALLEHGFSQTDVRSYKNPRLGLDLSFGYLFMRLPFGTNAEATWKKFPVEFDDFEERLFTRTPLHVAAEHGHVAAMAALLRAGANIDARDNSRATPLCYATTNETWRAFQYLLERGATIGNDALHRATKNNNIAAMRMLLFGKGVDKDVRDYSDQTALHVAAEFGKEIAMKMLLDIGVNVNVHDRFRNSPLDLAARHNNVKCIRMLVSANADIGFGILSKITYKQLDALKTLIELGADVNGSNIYFFNSPLLNAVEQNSEEGVKLLLNAGANVHEDNLLRDSITHLAHSPGNEGLLRVLINAGANVTLGGIDGETPLIWAAKFVAPELIRILVDAGAPLEDRDNSNQTALHWAATAPWPAAVRTLVALGANLNARDSEGRTPLHRSLNCNSSFIQGSFHGLYDSLEDGSQSRRDETTEILLAAGANVHAQTNDGETALMYLARFCRLPSLLERLLRAGARFEDHRRDGKTALHLAASDGFVSRTRASFVKALLDRGANVKATDMDGRTPLHDVIESEDVESIALLLEAGADPNARDLDQRTPIHEAARNGKDRALRALLNATGADVGARDVDGVSPLMAAAFVGEGGAVRALTRAGAALEDRDLDGRTALHWTVWQDAFGHRLVGALRVLLDLGASVSASDREGKTPLHLAARWNDEAAVRMLLSAGADPNARDAQGNSPLHEAKNVQAPNKEVVVQMLLAAGAGSSARNVRGQTALAVTYI